MIAVLYPVSVYIVSGKEKKEPYESGVINETKSDNRNGDDVLL
jgi:hypothetical protein